MRHFAPDTTLLAPGDGAQAGSDLTPTRGVLALLVALLVLTSCTDSVSPEAAVDSVRAPVQLTAEVDRAEATSGDIIRYKVTLDRDPDIPVELPDVFSQIEGFLVADIKREGPVMRDGRMVQGVAFDLQAFEVGSYILPALEVSYTDPRGDAQTAGAPQIFVEIKSVLGEDDSSEASQAPAAQMADIKPALEAPPNYRTVGLLGAGGAMVLLLTATALIYWRRRRRQEPLPPPPPPPWEVALEALERLGGIEMGEEEAPRAYCYSLSEIFRRYLEARFAFPALEETTEEILAAFRIATVPRGRPQELARRVLTSTDGVKYAKQIPARQEAEAMLTAARDFVRATIPPPPVTTEGNAKEMS